MKSIKKIYKYLELHSSERMEKSDVLGMERRLQMLLALTLFTPTILSSLGSDTFQQNKMVLTFGAVVAIYIAAYILIEVSKGRINKLRGNIINWGIWINLTAFIPFFISIALYQGMISGLPLVIFLITLATVFWSPLLFIILLGLEFVLGELFSLKNGRK